MTNKKKSEEIQELIKSKQLAIGKFLVKVSMVDTGNDKTYLVVVKSLVDNNFTMKYFDQESDVVNFLQMLQLI